MKNKKIDYILLTRDILSFIFVIFHLYLVFSGLIPNIIQRSIHIALSLPLIFLYFPPKKKKITLIVDIIFSILSFSSAIYISLFYEKITYQYGIMEGKIQEILAIIIIIMVLEGARRSVKPALPIIATLFLLYAFFGHLLPGYFGHVKFEPASILGMLYLTTNGIWGIIVGISVNIIAIFVILGAMLVVGGGGEGFIKFSLKVAGRFIGGPAKVAVISSALFGSISGSASANVASTGVFTIPMMKKIGYDKNFASAVEATASSGGQIMPPIMGAGAFIMAELIQIPYLKIAIAASIPALLYFYSVGTGIHFYSLKEGKKGLPPEEIPTTTETIKATLFFIIPLTTLVVLLVKGFTPQYAAFWTVMITIILFPINTSWSIDLKSIWKKIYKGTINGARQAAIIGSITACAQIIIGIINQTGLGVKLSSFILDFSKNNLFLALILTMITSIILGMEVPTTAAYLVAVVIGGPTLIKLGVNPIAAHLFVFYFAIISAITPPVCGAVYIAAGIADANWIKAAKFAILLGFSAFIIPYLFVYDPSLLLLSNPLFIIYGLIRSILAVTLISAAGMGYLKTPLNSFQRILLFLVSILFIIKNLYLNLIGIGIIVILYYFYLKSPSSKYAK